MYIEEIKYIDDDFKNKKDMGLSDFLLYAKTNCFEKIKALWNYKATQISFDKQNIKIFDKDINKKLLLNMNVNLL